MKRKILAFVLIFTMLMTPILSSSEANDGVRIHIFGQGEPYERLEDLINYISNVYLYGVTEEELIEAAFKGVFSVLDQYSRFYNKEEYEEMYKTIMGTFSGVGIYIAEDASGYVKVVGPIDGSPAHRAGVRAGDLIYKVNDEDMTGRTLEYVRNLIRGPVGEDVKLTLKRGISTLEIVIRRDIIKINPVEYSVLENDIGYIKITEFNDSSYPKFLSAVYDLKDKGVSKLVLDLRNNPGGLVNHALAIAQELVTKGSLLKVYSSRGLEIEYTSGNSKVEFDDVVLLVNSGSASASEIVAVALKDRGFATIVGERTFGKGVVQQVMNYGEEGFKLTYQEYRGPSDTRIHGVGIEPDYNVKIEYAGIDLNSFEELRFLKNRVIGNMGYDIYGIEQRLKALNFLDRSPTGFYDMELELALSKYADYNGIRFEGVITASLIASINKSFIDAIEHLRIDTQLLKAIELLR